VTRVRTAVGVGELLWDLLSGGERLGGAPFNVIAHVRRFGWRAAYVTAVGDDERGRRAREEVARLDVDTSLIETTGLPTGVVEVRLDEAGVPDYHIVSPAAYEAPRSRDDVAEVLGGRVDLIVFGTLAQRSAAVRGTTRRLAAEAPDAVRLYDVNLRRGRWDLELVRELLALATDVKMNREEQEVLAAELALPAGSLEAFADAVSERYRIRSVCVTGGASGAALSLDGTYLEAHAPTVRVIDTVGAGDAFAAALGVGLVEGWTSSRILDVATGLAGHVVSHEGAIPASTPSDLIERLPRST
jgi:fructokinase